MGPAIAVIGFIIFLGLIYAVLFNGLIALKNRAESAWADIDTQLKRRYDLIPNIVETVKGYASHEKETLERVIQARNSAISAGSVQDQGKAENILTGALRQVFALAEAYPDLKANTNFINLQETLADTENQIQNSRQYYNAVVRDLNTKVESFPSNIVANMAGVKKRDYFELDDAQQRQAPKVSFS